MQNASDGRIVAQVHYASRLPRFMARQDYLSGILRRIGVIGLEKCNFRTFTTMNNSYPWTTIPYPPKFESWLALEVPSSQKPALFSRPRDHVSSQNNP
jgi:hypothetical protein